MGYRSEVGLALTKQGVEIMQRKLSDPALEEKTRERITDFLTHAEKHAQEESGEEA